MSDLCQVPDCERPLSSKGYCKMHAERVRRFGTTDLVGRRRRTPEARLWEKVDTSAGPDECWPFTGSITFGYGHIRLGGKADGSTGAHRLAWMLANPGSPAPEMLDHLCHDPRHCQLAEQCPHRRCCNPSHLTPATPAENSAPHRRFGYKPTQCPRGHQYTEENTYVYTRPNGLLTRRCRRCNTDAARRARERSAA